MLQILSLWHLQVNVVVSARHHKCKAAKVMLNLCLRSAKVQLNTHMLPSRREAKLRHSPNFSPSLKLHFSISTKVWLVEQTLSTLPYMDVHYAARSTTTRIFQPQSIRGWTSIWR